MSKIWIEEFLYRGRPDGDPSWHVQLGTMVDDGLAGQHVVIKGPMTPEQAEKLGFPLSVVLGEINAEVLRHRDELLAESEKLKGKIEELKGKIEAAAG